MPTAPTSAVQGDRDRVLAVIPAAGESRRMGRNKLLLPWDSVTVLARTIANVRSSAVADILVVTGHDREPVTAIVEAAGVKTIFNPDYANGFLSSVQTAIRSLTDDFAAVVIVLGDQPLINPEIIDKLLAAYHTGSCGLVAPAFRGQRGHPVIIDRRYFNELLSLPADGAPRFLLQRHPDDVALVEVPSDAILHDLDTPEDYARWRP